MELPKSVKSQKNQNLSPHEHDHQQISSQKNFQKGVKISKPHKLFSSQKKNSPSYHKQSELKNFHLQQMRLRAQQKLMYIKQCNFKNVKHQQIFVNYPYSKYQQFIFNEEKLKDLDGNIIGKIIQDNQGIHLIQEIQEQHKQSRYITLSQKEQLNKFNGLAVSIFHNGAIFQGNYHNGKFCGDGYELQSSGNLYIGHFKEGTKSGFGTFYWFSRSQSYSGEWHGGLPHGPGVYSGKDIYHGFFSNGFKNGYGQQSFSNGDRYQGQYINGVADGYGQYFWKDGSIYKGDFKNGVRHGYGIWQDSSQQYKGVYRMDKKQGFGVYIWKGKQIYRGQFKQDFRQGYGEFYQYNKQFNEKLIYKGAWQKGKKNQNGKINQEQIKKLYQFLDQTHQLDKNIQKISKKSKPRVGHKNCIPHQQYNTPPKRQK